MPNVERVVRSERGGADLQLSQAERKDLFNMAHLPGWDVFLDLFEAECIKAETACLREIDDAKVLVTHKLAKAYWQAFETLQKRVQFEIKEGLENGEAAQTVAEIPEEEQ